MSRSRKPVQTGREIVETPGICGGRARVYGTRITVSGLERARRIGWKDRDFLKNYPSLTQSDLNNAWQFVKANRSQIEQDISDKNGPPTVD